MSNREKQLIGLVGILLVLLLGYYLLYRPLMNQRDELESEIETLTAEVEVLREEYAKMPEYKEGIEASRRIIDDIVERYPGGLSQEAAFKLLFALEEEIEDVDFSSVSFAPPEILSYSNEGNPEKAVRALAQSVRSTQKLEYEDVKEFLEFLYGYEDRTVLNGLSLSLNEEEGLIDMSVNMTMYALEGPDRPYELPTFEEVPFGNDTPFASEKATVAAETRVRETQVQDAASDLFIALKPIASDIEAQVIGLTSDTIQSSYIKKDINGRVNAILRIYESNGRYYANYDIDGTYKESQSFDVGSALELDLFSAMRLDEFDKVAMDLEIINETSMTLYINRKEEDLGNPRFSYSVSKGNVEYR